MAVGDLASGGLGDLEFKKSLEFGKVFRISDVFVRLGTFSKHIRIIRRKLTLAQFL